MQKFFTTCILLLSTLSIAACGAGGTTESLTQQSQIDADPEMNPAGQGDGPGGCDYDHACRCAYWMTEAAAGRTVTQSDLNGMLGGSATDMFTSGGSMNIPTMCRAAKYYIDGDRAWFNEYFDVQKNNPNVGFMGREVLSPLYGSLVAGAVLLVKKHAERRNQTDLIQKSKEWLRAYWALHSLTAVARNSGNLRYVDRTGLYNIDPLQGARFGVAVGGAGTRRGKGPGVGGTNLAQPMLAMALDLPRNVTWPMKTSWAFYGGLRTGVLVAGYHFGANWGPLLDFGQTRDANIFGITSQERSQLASFLQSNGEQNLQLVLDMVGSYKPSCHITFLRTQDGPSSFFGTNSDSQNICNRNKGPYFAGRVDRDGETTWLGGTEKNAPAESAYSYRNGNRACARVVGIPNEMCMDLPGGQRIYEIEWIRGHGINVVYRSDGGGGGHTTTTTTTTTSTTMPPNPHPGPSTTPPDMSQCSNSVLCLGNGRYRVTANWFNQYNNQSGVAGAVPNTNLAGFLHFGDPSNVEIIVKVLNFGTSVKVFYGQLTNLRFNLFVKDMVTGVVRMYSNTSGDCGGIDHEAFASGGIWNPIQTPRPPEPNPGGIQEGSCRPNATTLCLDNGRLSVRATWRNQYNNTSGASTVRNYSPVTGGLYFADASNLELLVKAVDFGSYYLIMYGTLSDLEYDMTVTDTITGRTRTYHNNPGNYCGGLDSQTFIK